MGGCWVCNPFCGKCKPPIKKLQCPVCGKLNFPELMKENTCSKCGAVLPEIKEERVWCTFIQQICINPCGKKNAVPADDEPRICEHHTPLQSTTAENC